MLTCVPPHQGSKPIIASTLLPTLLSIETVVFLCMGFTRGPLRLSILVPHYIIVLVPYKILTSFLYLLVTNRMRFTLIQISYAAPPAA